MRGEPEIQILRSLQQAAPSASSAMQVARTLGLSLATIQHGLVRLEEAGYVTSRSPRVPLYTLTQEGVAAFQMLDAWSPESGAVAQDARQAPESYGDKEG